MLIYAHCYFPRYAKKTFFCKKKSIERGQNVDTTDRCYYVSKINGFMRIKGWILQPFGFPSPTLDSHDYLMTTNDQIFRTKTSLGSNADIHFIFYMNVAKD